MAFVSDYKHKGSLVWCNYSSLMVVSASLGLMSKQPWVFDQVYSTRTEFFPVE